MDHSLTPARSRKRFATKPKRYFADPSLPCAMLGVSSAGLLEDWQTFGLIFENMVMRDLAVYASTLDLSESLPLRYYRDDSGLEADAVIQLADGNWAAFEIKTSEDKVPNGVESLRRMRTKLLKNPQTQTRPPKFMAVITGNGEFAREVEDGIYVIPIRTLGA
ncbi:DUF4143 domain-containing protein [Curtanaerobium respiraculi]|uniref:DUF4143 domain-containing protein n=1 Tax=Curtanaerobium respiraculi TaxID=2949669 RepID=UPI0024B339E7|nr:DUF4143 domain-containing protein [Curtanaerobium respiraculi]